MAGKTFPAQFRTGVGVAHLWLQSGREGVCQQWLDHFHHQQWRKLQPGDRRQGFHFTARNINSYLRRQLVEAEWENKTRSRLHQNREWFLAGSRSDCAARCDYRFLVHHRCRISGNKGCPLQFHLRRSSGKISTIYRIINRIDGKSRKSDTKLKEVQ